MKSNHFTLLITILTFFLPFVSFSQWIQKYGNDTKSFNKVYTFNKDTAIAVGRNGTILKTVDGGETWDLKSSGTTHTLWDITFVSPTTGYACGDTGTLLRSTDGGNSWTARPVFSTITFCSLDFLDENMGWIAAASTFNTFQHRSDFGMILKTTDGGVLFHVDTAINSGIFAIGHFNADTLLALSNREMDYTSFLFRSIDGGGHWETILESPLGGEMDAIETFPGGEARILNLFNLMTLENYGITTTGSYPLLMPSFGFSFPSLQTGYAVGWDPLASYGMIEKTTDGGHTWAQQAYGYFNSVNFVNDTVGYAVTFDGKIFKTENGGELVGIRDLAGSTGDAFSIYPNPFTSSVRIKADYVSSLNDRSVSCEVYSMTGERIRSFVFTGNTLEIKDLSGLPCGLYNFLVRDKANILFQRKALKINTD
jgi:photosystem II stability/assembly factor-like uncharacterized protein